MLLLIRMPPDCIVLGMYIVILPRVLFSIYRMDLFTDIFEIDYSCLNESLSALEEFIKLSIFAKFK